MMKSKRLIKYLIVTSLFILPPMFMVVQSLSWQGRLLALSMLLTGSVFFQYDFVKRKRWLWLNIIWIPSVLILLYQAALSPTNTGHFTSQYFDNAQSGKSRIYNILSEEEQLNYGVVAAMLFDPFVTYSKSSNLRTDIDRVYEELEADEDFQNQGTMLGNCIEHLVTGEPKVGHYYRYIPKSHIDGSPLPVIIFIHGSMGNFKGYHWIMKTVADETGYAIVAPSFGAGLWMDAKGQDVIDNCLEDFAKDFKLRRSKVVMCAISNGGLGACIYAKKQPEKLQGLILITPVIEGVSIRSDQFRTGWKGRKICMISGKKDVRIPYSYLEQHIQQMENHGVTVNEMIVEDADHFLMFSHREEAVEQIKLWIASFP